MVERIRLLLIRSRSLENKTFMILLHISGMEIFGKSLSNFEKPLIIVIVLVGILINGVLVLNFVLNLGGGQINHDPKADVSFTQAKISSGSMNETNRYIVHLSVDDMYKELDYSNSYYLVVTKAGSKEDTRFAKNVSTEPSEYALAPDNAGQSHSLSDSEDGVILINESDSAYVIGPRKGDRVRVFGSNGVESLVASYEVK